MTKETGINEAKKARELEENEFELPIGITLNGELHKYVTLTEMTGVTEEAISDSKVRNNGGKVITEAIFGVIESLGDITKTSKHMVRQLYSVDRDYLLLMNHKVSVGDDVEYTDDCPKCGGKNDVSIDIDSIEVKRMDEDESRFLKMTLPNGVKTKDGKVYKNITVSLPTGGDQENIFTLLQQNPNQAITKLLAYICEDIEGLDTWTPDTFKHMTKKDRKHITTELGKIEVGANLHPEVMCANCGDEYQSTIPVQVLLGE